MWNLSRGSQQLFCLLSTLRRRGRAYFPQPWIGADGAASYCEQDQAPGLFRYCGSSQPVSLCLRYGSSALSSTCSLSTAEGNARRLPHGLALKRLPELGVSGAPESLCRLPGRFEGRCGIFSCHSDSRLNVGQSASSRSSKHG